jgi:hypothetical protein
MKNLGIRFRARVGDHIDRGRIALVRQIPAIQKNGESVGLSKSRAETQQRITIGKKRVRLRNFFTKARAVFMRVQTCSVIFREVSEPVASPVTVTSAVSAGLFEISADGAFHDRDKGFAGRVRQNQLQARLHFRALGFIAEFAHQRGKLRSVVQFRITNPASSFAHLFNGSQSRQ